MEMLRVVLPVIVMLAIGYICREKNLISGDGIKGMQALVMNFTLPANLFLNFYKTRIESNTITFPLTILLLVVLGIFTGKLFCRLFKEEDAVMPFMTTGYEVGMLGFALLAILIGAENITTFAIMDIGHEIAIFTVYLVMLKATNGEKQSVGATIRDMLTTPVLMAIILGVILGNTGIGGTIGASSFGPVLDQVCSFIAAPTSAVILVVIGYGLSFKDVKWLTIGKAIVIRLIQQTIMAAVVFGVYYKLGGVFWTRETIVSLIVFFILPPPYIIPLFTEKEERRIFYSSAISMYTILTIVGFIIVAGVLYL
ncbi:MAG: AEC family transporter [Blautia sp.]|nr:AEC family transporter [Blautia sp.]